MPAIPRPRQVGCRLPVLIAFEGVDGSGWVWVDGVFVGAYDIGPSGWNEPFRLDVAARIRWNAENGLCSMMDCGPLSALFMQQAGPSTGSQ